MVFLRLVFPTTNKLGNIYCDSDDQQQWRSTLQQLTGVPASLLSFHLAVGSKVVLSDATVDVGLRDGLKGGKGGFGSMLRALGAQIEKTTNREACRDLSGRRLRDINEEERLKRYIAKQAEREREAAERAAERKAKLERIVKNDHKPELRKTDGFEEQNEKCIEAVHDAVDAYLAKINKDNETEDEQGDGDTKRIKNKISTSSSTTTPKNEGPKASGSGVKRTVADRDLWLGVSLNDSDLDTSSDEEDDESSDHPPSKAVKVN